MVRDQATMLESLRSTLLSLYYLQILCIESYEKSILTLTSWTGTS